MFEKKVEKASVPKYDILNKSVKIENKLDQALNSLKAEKLIEPAYGPSEKWIVVGEVMVNEVTAVAGDDALLVENYKKRAVEFLSKNDGEDIHSYLSNQKDPEKLN